MQYALPGCSLLVWALLLFVGLDMWLPTAEHVRFFRWLPALMVVVSLALMYAAKTKYGEIPAQIGSLVLILVSAVFFLALGGGV